MQGLLLRQFDFFAGRVDIRLLLLEASEGSIRRSSDAWAHSLLSQPPPAFLKGLALPQQRAEQCRASRREALAEAARGALQRSRRVLRRLLDGQAPRPREAVVGQGIEGLAEVAVQPVGADLPFAVRVIQQQPGVLVDKTRRNRWALPVRSLNVGHATQEQEDEGRSREHGLRGEPRCADEDPQVRHGHVPILNVVAFAAPLLDPPLVAWNVVAAELFNHKIERPRVQLLFFLCPRLCFRVLRA
mmetsp:Transcript_33830/g.110651  ORF Transcript_33830/g.110651 Transcript_33830/m.110651 type:complete len:244 (+) Transcript_33830:1297-2028(+)